MTDTADKESKTELPSEKRISEALEKGNSPHSREVVTLGSMLAFLLVGGLTASAATYQIGMHLADLLANVGTVNIHSSTDVSLHLQTNLETLAAILIPILACIALGGMVGALGQNVPSATLERVRPKFEKLSPSANAKRIFGREALLEFGKILLKSIVVVAVVVSVFRNNMTQILSASMSEVSQVPVLMLRLCLAVLAPLCLLALLIAIVDVILGRLKWRNDLKMTRQEVKDEHKQSEGDQHIKERIKRIGRQRIKSRMMSDLPRATLVVVNPTHFAVAMRYVPAEGGAPIVLAKGIDHLALRIKETCGSLQIPIVENQPLARALYAATSIGSMIPAEHYRAVAEVIHFVEMRKRLSRPKFLQG